MLVHTHTRTIWKVPTSSNCVNSLLHCQHGQLTNNYDIVAYIVSGAPDSMIALTWTLH